VSIAQGIHKNLQLWRDKATHPAENLVMNPHDITTLAREQIGNKFATKEEWHPVPLHQLTEGLRFGRLYLTSDPGQAPGMLSINGNGGFTL
jgi:hypothetical protein